MMEAKTMKIETRLAELSDSPLYFSWANDPDVRANSFNQNPILLADHENWFHKMLQSKDHILLLFSIEANHFGQLRFALSNDDALINYSIAKEFRGKGLSTKMIQHSITYLKHHFPQIKNITAKVKPENIASRKAFESCNFRVHTISEQEITFNYPLS
jgi:UDP-2,4-diacetamido-2,4,6-trideoxy-beta-L-altropyranose hydrolase